MISPAVRKGGLFPAVCSTRTTLDDILGIACELRLESVESESVDVCASFKAHGLRLSQEDAMVVRGDTSRSIAGDNGPGELFSGGLSSGVAPSLERLLVVIDDGRIGIHVQWGGSLCNVRSG